MYAAQNEKFHREIKYKLNERKIAFGIILYIFLQFGYKLYIFIVEIAIGDDKYTYTEYTE